MWYAVFNLTPIRSQQGTFGELLAWENVLLWEYEAQKVKWSSHAIPNCTLTRVLKRAYEIQSKQRRAATYGNHCVNMHMCDARYKHSHNNSLKLMFNPSGLGVRALSVRAYAYSFLYGWARSFHTLLQLTNQWIGFSIEKEILFGCVCFS